MVANTKKEIDAVDLFCGAGGTSAGLYDAANELGIKVNLLAINHWYVAIKTHGYNHTLANHLCESLDNVNPRNVVPSGRLKLLVASPECTHHSNARGGKPKNEQSRATAWHVLRWAEALRIDNIIIENVTEFLSWGPLGANGKPLKSKKGETYKAFIIALKSLGYKVEDRILNAADYGDATARKRLFIIARRGHKKIKWPKKTHGPGCKKPYRTAREIIDWNYESQSIFGRKRPLKPNTLRRIEAGLRKFGGEAFLAMFYGTNDARSINRPCPTITADGQHIGICEPFLVEYHGKTKGERRERIRTLNDPLPTQDTSNRFGLCEPFLVNCKGTKESDLKNNIRSVDRPTPAQCGRNSVYLCEPFLVNMKGQSKSSDVNKPMPTQCSKNHLYLCEPFLTKYYGTAKAVSVDKPLDAVTTKDRFALVQPVANGYKLDINFRMLQPHELAAAMSLQDFIFFGTKTQITKQIGNAVAEKNAKAMCLCVLD